MQYILQVRIEQYDSRQQGRALKNSLGTAKLFEVGIF